jgi:hypothetical protein
MYTDFFDSNKFKEKFISAKNKGDEADTISEAISSSNSYLLEVLASKEDLKNLKKDLRTDLKIEIMGLENRLLYKLSLMIGNPISPI